MTRMYLDATGGVTVELETAAHGQGQETAAVEIVAAELGVAPSTVSVMGGWIRVRGRGPCHPAAMRAVLGLWAPAQLSRPRDS